MHFFDFFEEKFGKGNFFIVPLHRRSGKRSDLAVAIVPYLSRKPLVFCREQNRNKIPG